MDFLTDYLTENLEQAGFPAHNLDLEYSLSYSQGDGVAFYGDLTTVDCMKLYSVIYGEATTEKEKQRKAMYERLMRSYDNMKHMSCDAMLLDREIVLINIVGNKFSYSYNHYNTMHIDEDSGIGNFFFGDYVGLHRAEYDENYFAECYEFHIEEKRDYQALWNEFITDLSDYVESTSHRLAKIGYEYIEACEEYDEEYDEAC